MILCEAVTNRYSFMFHQANLRNMDVETFTVGTQTGKMSLIQIWVETIVQEMSRM
jgi:hypothetical protein